MLSSSVIKNVSQASHYYSHEDNYYSRDEGIEQSEWWGKGAQQLGITGQVDKDQFTELLKGKLPTGDQLGIVIDGKMNHRAGWDLTFSAPKSVSILAYVGGDKRLIDAHRKAVSIALSTIEKGMAQARVKTVEGMQYQNTGNLVAALYQHDLSRAKDPQMHTHAVVMNMTQRRDGKWRSLASQIGRYNENSNGEINGFIERVRHHNRYLSKIYETELAYQVKQLGYEITTETKSGIFEIKEVSHEAVQYFSKRRNQIEEKLEEKGLSGGKAAAIATLDTRAPKEEVNRERLKEQWDNDAKSIGLNCQPIISASYQKIQNPTLEPEAHHSVKIDQNVLEAILKSSQSLSVFQTTFSLEELIAEASNFAIENSLSVNSLLTGIEFQIKEGELISLTNEQGKTTLILKSTLDQEKQIESHLKDNKLPKPKFDDYQISNYLTQHEEIDIKNHAYLQTAFDSDRVVLLEGKAAKEILVKPILDIAKSADLNVAIISPSLVGSKQFAKDVKHPSQNIWERLKSLFVEDNTHKYYSVMQFLSEFKDVNKSNKNIPDLIIVDNANLLSTHQKANLFEWNTTHQSKLILMGDKDTLLSQQRGNSLDEVVLNGIPTISLSDNTNLLTKSKKENLNELINKMANKVVEVKATDERQHAMAKHYVNLSEIDRKSSWLVGQTKKSVEQLNMLAHQTLTESNQIKKQKEINVLIPVFLPEGKAILASSYKKDQVVRFNEAYSSLSINRGEYLKIINSNEKSNRVILQKEDGKQVICEPNKVAGKSGNVELFEEKRREIGVGESVILNRSLKSKQIVKGERFIVENILFGKVKLRGADGKSTILDTNKAYHRHFDYGYAATPHAMAHEKPIILITELEANSFLTDQRRFNQAVSQPKEAWIYTDDLKNLSNQLENKSGDRLTAHETLKKAEELKSNLHQFFDELEKQLTKLGMEKTPDAVKKSIDAVDYAMRHLSEREAGFTHKDLMKVAMSYAIGKVTQEMLSEVTREMRKAGILIQANRNDGTLWTTTEAVKIEREILALTLRDQNKLQPITSDDRFQVFCEQNSLRPEQSQAIKTIVQSTDRVLSIQGRAGTGKTTMMVTLNDILSSQELLKESGYSLLGIAPTNKAVNELRSRGITAQTVHSFINEITIIMKNNTPTDFSKAILVVDEASMVSNRKFLEVMKITHDLNFRQMIATGDTAQNPAIESGKPHELVQRALGDTTILLADIQRQKNPILKEAVKTIYEGNVAETFSVLKDVIFEINEKTASDGHDQELKGDDLKEKYYEKRISTIAKDYVSTLLTGEEVQIIAPSHKDRVAVNTNVRSLLNDQNILQGKENAFGVFSSKDLSGVERSEAANFKAGDILRFSRASGKTIKSGDYFTIKNIDKNHNLLTLKSLTEGNQEIIWQVPRSVERINNTVEVFKEESRNLKVGDKIIWLHTNKKEQMFSSDIVKVTKIENANVTIERADKTLFTFNGNDHKNRHWDHAYAITSHAAQGGSYSTILAIYETRRQKLNNLKNFLVTITRPINHLRIYTDNTEILKKSINSNLGDKKSSLEIIGEYPSSQKESLTTKKVEQQGVDSKINQGNSTHKIKPTVSNKVHYDKFTIEKIKEGLNRDAEKIALEILDQPKIRGSNFLKFGTNQGSLSVTTKGEKQGWWNDFSDNAGGRSMLSFIQKYASLDKEKALEYGANWLGIHPGFKDQNKNFKIRNTEKSPSTIEDKKLKAEQQKKIEFAKKLVEQSKTIEGTLVEKYLREHRGVTLDKLPDDVLFHPGIYSKLNGKTLPAMLVIARDKSGEIRAVQATYLDASTANKIDNSLIQVQKQTFGLLKGATVNLSGEKNAQTLLAEGIETGLSLASVLKNVNVKVTLSKSNFINIDTKSVSEKVVFCVDNDGQDIKSDKLLAESAKRLKDNNKQVYFMVPASGDKQKADYNDVLKHLGPNAIRTDFDNKISFKSMYKLSLNEEPNTLLSQYKEMLSNDKKSLSELAEKLNHSTKIHSITDKFIKGLPSSLAKNNSPLESDKFNSNGSIGLTKDNTDLHKSINKVKDIERDF